MAVTVRQLLNRVLSTLGEDEIAAATTDLVAGDYDALVLNFLNIIKEEVEAAHNWRALRSFESVTVSANAISGDVSNGTEASRIYRIHDADTGVIAPICVDVTDSSNPDVVREIDLAKLLYLDKVDPDVRASDSPSYFAYDALGASTSQLYVWPRPNSNRSLSIGLIIPQARLARDSLDTNLLVPARVLELGTLWFALEERGEELGINGVFTEERYRKALDDSIARDSAEQGDTFELVPV